MFKQGSKGSVWEGSKCNSTHKTKARLVFVHIGVGECCFASIVDEDASTLQQEEQVLHQQVHESKAG